MDAADVFRLAVPQHKEAAVVSEFFEVVDAMPPDSFLAAVVMMYVAMEAVCGR
jgi:hypothetical protein